MKNQENHLHVLTIPFYNEHNRFLSILGKQKTAPTNRLICPIIDHIDILIHGCNLFLTYDSELNPCLLNLVYL